ncbi:DUF664 domain-containing protein [Amycolatopsis sp. FDAARGOS 1241]|uniref:mycothiol transferase n=1 Tax=Amycolatopsis sp. FDAARGOS 1241 TaxID=2778070 RepID=UPI00351C5CD4
MSNRSSKVERTWPDPLGGDELTVQIRFVGLLRATPVNKLAGLDTPARVTPHERPRRGRAPDGCRTLVAVERWWLSIEVGSSSPPALWAGSPDPSWDLTQAADPASVTAPYQAEWTHSAAALTGLAPDDRTRRSGDFTVRWVPAHVVQETGRHVGHLDTLRELADGEVGE